jgi:hypothetical protein
MYDHAVEFLSLSFDRMLTMYQRFAASSSEETLLDAIVAVVRSEFSRVAVFSVQPDSFEGVSQDGFAAALDFSQLAIPRALDTVLAQAVMSNQVEVLAGADLMASGGPLFGGTPTVALALPIAAGAEPIAVVYADDSDQPNRELATPELRQKFADLVRQQATPFLARIMADRRQLADLDDYAAVLIKHLASMHAADVKARVPERDRQQRLSQNLEYARRLYAQRAQKQGPHAAARLDERLAATADAKRNSAFGRDLLTITRTQETTGAAVRQ